MVVVAQQFVTHQCAGKVRGLVLHVETYELLRLMVRKRPQQQRAGHGKDRRIRADSQGKGDDRRKRESWTLNQHAGAKAEITKESLHAAIIGIGKKEAAAKSPRFASFTTLRLLRHNYHLLLRNLRQKI